eukprot:Skav226536  [mRNA]  locus=scaffold4831:171920:204024:- [translate_table: standard]
MLAEDPNPVLPLGTGSQGTQMAIGDDDERQVGQSPDGTLSQFIRSPGSHNQVVPVNPFRVPPGGDPSSIGPVGTPEGANFVQQNNLKQEYHQHQYQTNVRQELNVSLDPLLVAQAHHVVEQNRASVISQAQEALNQSRDQLREEANQAVIQAQEAAKAEALTYVHRVEAEARQNASNAQTEIEQLRKRAAETSTELRNRAKAEVALVEAEANRRIATLEGRISELTHERDNLAQMVQGMSNNQDGFENTVQSLMEEKETLVNRVQSLMINQDVLEGDIRSLMGEREMLTKRVQMLIDEKQDTIQKAQRMLDERDRLISELTGRVQDQNETITNLRNTIGIIQGSAMKPPVQSIVGAGNGAGSSKGVPKNEVKSKQSVETAIQEMKTMLVKLEQRVSRSPSAKEKKTSEAADASVAAAPGQSKGKSKGKGTEKPSASSSAKPSKEEKKKDPCMYFAYSACTKGDKCPYLHDKNNLYKGPKPKALTTSHAGAAQIVSGAVAATTILGTQGASSLSAPCRHVMEEECCSTRSREDGSDLGAVQGSDLGAVQGSDLGAVQGSDLGAVQGSDLGALQNRTWREFIEESNVVKLGRRCKPTKKDQKGKMFACPRMFEKAIKCFAAIAAVCEPSSYHQEFLVDSGAGRNLISSKDMPEPWNHYVAEAPEQLPEPWNHYIAEAPEQLRFATGGGMRPSTKAIRLKGSLSGEGVFYTLRDCPAALSLGQQVNEQAMPAVDDPSKPAASSVDPVGDGALGEKPPRAPSEGAVSVGEKPPPAPPESDVPPGEVLTRDVDERLLEGDPETGSDYTPSLAEDVPKEDPATGGELVLASDPSHKDPPSSDDEVEEISANHQLTHYPKSRSCEVCMRAKMTARYHRKRGDPDPEEAPPLHYGHQIRVDHLIMGSDLQKGSEGEQACLVCFDEYSGCYQAFPQTQRTTENNIACLRKFGGTKAHGKALCVVKSDAAKELTEAVKALDWLPDEAIPNDAFHNAKLESNIRRLKEGVRACHLAAGFSHELWPRIDAGYVHKKVHYVLDYESLRTNAKGCGRPIQVHMDEIVVPDKIVFPMYEAAKARDEGGSGELPKIALPFEEGAPKTPARVRRTYITLERAIKFGKTVGCKGCERIAEGVKHSDACHERFRLLLEEESKKAKTEAEEKKKLLALEDKPKIPSEPSRGPELPDFENLMEAVHESDEAKRKARGLPAGAAKAKTSTDAENLGDYWELRAAEAAEADGREGRWRCGSTARAAQHGEFMVKNGQGWTSLRLRVGDAREAEAVLPKYVTSWLLLFALSDGTAPDFGASNRGFVASLTGIEFAAPTDTEMNTWKGIFSSILKMNFCFQIARVYGLVDQIRAEAEAKAAAEREKKEIFDIHAFSKQAADMMENLHTMQKEQDALLREVMELQESMNLSQRRAGRLVQKIQESGMDETVKAIRNIAMQIPDDEEEEDFEEEQEAEEENPGEEDDEAAVEPLPRRQTKKATVQFSPPTEGMVTFEEQREDKSHLITAIGVDRKGGSHRGADSALL